MQPTTDALLHVVQHQKKLFEYLKEDLIVSKRLTNELIKNGHLVLNGQPIKNNITIKPGDELFIHFKDETNDYVPYPMPLNILYETDDLLVVNKPAGLVMYDPKNIETRTLANAVSHYYQQIGLKRKIRFINRLDQDTSGVVIIAKNPYAHQFIEKSSAFREKKYVAIIDGVLPQDEMIVETGIARTIDGHAVTKDGKNSCTRFQQIMTNGKETLVLCFLQTGRTHQIRLHLNRLGTPIIGDSLYGKSSSYINRQALHAYHYSFIEPRLQQTIRIQAPLFQDMERLIQFLFTNHTDFYGIM